MNAMAIIKRCIDDKSIGEIHFKEIGDAVKVYGVVTNLTPGLHGFHVHESGIKKEDCGDFCGHYNPYNVEHGGRDSNIRHVGDLGNIEADKFGIARINFTDKIIKLKDIHNIVGRSIIIHDNEDDLGLGGYHDSKTTGHAGGRYAYGIIFATTN